MAGIYWMSRGELSEDRDYLLVATTGLAIPWFRPVRMWRFTRATLGILAQLGRASGCLGYSLRPGLRHGSTVSVWEDAQSLKKFQRENPHADAMRTFRSRPARPFRYAQWRATSRTLPSSWKEITDHLAADRGTA
jgi:quinol monooxygenase YgiN